VQNKTLREDYRLSVSENFVWWKIFGFRRDKVTGNWRRLQNEGLHALYAFRVIRSRKTEIHGTCSTNGKQGIFIQGFLVEIHEGKRLPGRP
jgi:hypothetical protein